MQNLNFSGKFSNQQAKVSVKIGVFQFEENGVTILYSPAFDLSGYGKTDSEAKASFFETLDEFFDYTLKKKTFVTELNKLGWKLKESDMKKKNLKAPELAALISQNDYLAEILNEKNFRKFDETVAVPAF